MVFAPSVRAVQFEIQWSSLALLYYDYLLTFPDEVKYLWTGGRFSKISTLLYVLCRYALIANVLYLLAISDLIGTNCDLWYKLVGAASVLGRGAIVFTILMRTYVVCGRSITILVFFGTLGLIILGCDVAHVPGLRCRGPSSTHIANTLLSILVCAFEALATLVTLVRSIQALRACRGTDIVMKHTISYLLAEQGILYFSLVSAFTISSAVLNFKAPGGFLQRLLNAYTLPISCILTARFILRLRAFANRSHELDNQSISALIGPRATIADEFGEDPMAATRTWFADPSHLGGGEVDFANMDTLVERTRSRTMTVLAEENREPVCACDLEMNVVLPSANSGVPDSAQRPGLAGDAQAGPSRLL